MTIPHEIDRLIRMRAGGTILAVDQLDIGDAIQGVGVPVYVCTHYNARRSVTHESFGSFICLYRNSYLVGPVDNMALAMMAMQHFPSHLPQALHDLSRLFSGISRQFTGELLLNIAPTRLGRVLFLEALVEFDTPLRALFALKQRTEALRLSSEQFTRIATDFILFHEFGHTAKADNRFEPYIQNTLEKVRQFAHFDVWQGKERSRIEEEIFCDLFSVNAVFARYAPTCSAETLRNYGHLAVRLIARMTVLKDLAEDLHRQNYGDSQPATEHDELGLRLLEWGHREAALDSYINNFEFGQETVEAAPDDAYLAISWDEPAINAVADGGGLVEPLSDHSRRIAELISLGFEPETDFDAVVKSARTFWTLE